MNSKLAYSQIMFHIYGHTDISAHVLFKMTLGSKSYVFLVELDFKKPTSKVEGCLKGAFIIRFHGGDLK